ncbi:MAG TPA: sulfotransferase family 2 domain-containing protein [Sphingomicrobium sp.]|nr:sulfotransferase family 2 domain-containing protein [Sphingomicrobium sp.]
MIDGTDSAPAARLKGYFPRLREAVSLWSEAGKAARHDDSIFIWIPKNAGTSIHAVLRDYGFVKLKSPRSVRLSFRGRGRVTFGHMAVGSLVEAGLVSPQFVERSFKFAFTRDPYARAASLYHYLSNTYVIPNWHERPSFRQFLNLLADGFYDRIGLYNTRGLSQCSPQADWLRDTPPDKLYRIEDFGEFLTDIAERWGISASEIPYLNRSGNRAEIELEREDRALIEKIYAEDFDMLGYSRK